jgi:hypothetical protein
LNYGWEYQGPVGGSIQELDGCINAIVNRPNERFSRQQVAGLIGSYDIASTGKMLEVARRQGFIKSTFQDGPNDEKVRLYHSFDYKEEDWSVDSSTPIVSDNSPIVSTERSDDSHDEPFVTVSDDNNKPKLVAVDDSIPTEEWF